MSPRPLVENSLESTSRNGSVLQTQTSSFGTLPSPVTLSYTLHIPASNASPVSQRGVVFFRKQDEVDNDLQKELVQRLGELSGKPSTSKLHIHPVSNSGRELGGKDDEISVISSAQAKKIYKDRLLFQTEKKQSGKEGWHSDITFEPIPSDYALLRLTQLPKTGGGKSFCITFESA
jgi:alpha-ketoglutarate-dependent taurine dioxygenase